MTGDDDLDSRMSTAIELLHHVEGLITLGENRGNILALGSAGLLIAYAQDDLLVRVAGENSNFPIFFAAFALVFACLALWPQVQSTRVSKVTQSAETYYFGDIGASRKEVFVEDFLQNSNTKNIELVLSAVHARSMKARNKFSWLWLSTMATAAQFIPYVFKFFY